ncbi:NAD(P)-binding protein [Microthyrium microscopicum]|uniref:NAD(P)-binding protein n=1 Tax=Microthyrium microscopicum TaxID=703497 RepID=A0A6A6UEQ8_9PEZI|nr:NAD(P)-binding protein [Microthyrium microscopicum]
MVPKVYLISGANRGIGRALVTEYVSRDNTIVIGAVRDPSKDTSKSLLTLPTGENSRVILVKVDSLSTSDPSHAIKDVQENSIDHIDVVIANAGHCEFGPVVSRTAEDLQQHFNVNTIGPMLLFQAAWPLLNKAKEPKFIVISSTLGSLVEAPKYGLPSAAYGASKAALNYLTKIINIEHTNLIAMPICPGWTQTDMGATGARAAGLEAPPVPLEISIKGVVTEIDHAVRTEQSRFASHEHIDREW